MNVCIIICNLVCSAVQVVKCVAHWTDHVSRECEEVREFCVLADNVGDGEPIGIPMAQRSSGKAIDMWPRVCECVCLFGDFWSKRAVELYAF